MLGLDSSLNGEQNPAKYKNNVASCKQYKKHSNNVKMFFFNFFNLLTRIELIPVKILTLCYNSLYYKSSCTIQSVYLYTVKLENK